jgi:hypothetical protein
MGSENNDYIESSSPPNVLLVGLGFFFPMDRIDVAHAWSSVHMHRRLLDLVSFKIINSVFFLRMHALPNY